MMGATRGEASQGATNCEALCLAATEEPRSTLKHVTCFEALRRSSALPTSGGHDGRTIEHSNHTEA